MIVVTGAAGFIGSNLIAKLNKENYNDLVLVDEFTTSRKKPNYIEKSYTEMIDRDKFPYWLKDHHQMVEFIFHLGARTDTTEFNKNIFNKLNLNYSKKIWKNCTLYGIPLVYASSAATYGMGEKGYNDDHDIVEQLKPLNAYGESKNDFDKWVLEQDEKPYYWAGLKFFNVYGPNEYHKGRMASVVFHAFNQINDTRKMNLFKSHHPDFLDGEQCRDFIFVKDVVDVLYYLMHYRKNSGIYNLGTGKARTFRDLTQATFKAMDREENINFIETPIDIRDKYQYFTEANMQKLRSIGYTKNFTSLEDGIADYVRNFLFNNKYS